MVTFIGMLGYLRLAVQLLRSLELRPSGHSLSVADSNTSRRHAPFTISTRPPLHPAPPAPAPTLPPESCSAPTPASSCESALLGEGSYGGPKPAAPCA